MLITSRNICLEEKAVRSCALDAFAANHPFDTIALDPSPTGPVTFRTDFLAHHGCGLYQTDVGAVYDHAQEIWKSRAVINRACN
jgi:hypothetical protein